MGEERKKRKRPRRKHWVFITFHYKGRKNTKKRLRQKVGRAAVRALSNLTPNCGAHAHSPQCACWGRSQPGHGEGMWEQPVAYIRGAAQPMVLCFLLRGEMGPGA